MNRIQIPSGRYLCLAGAVVLGLVLLLAMATHTTYARTLPSKPIVTTGDGDGTPFEEPEVVTDQGSLGGDQGQGGSPTPSVLPTDDGPRGRTPDKANGASGSNKMLRVARLVRLWAAFKYGI